ncbi:MAG: sulfite exporter TauE/SafE family protein [Actinobacteria bacterium]|nr:sulfite exporter TauE/SafE family protein [Actinomycetota bacterium]
MVSAILPKTLTGTLRYARESYVNWRVATTCGESKIAFAAIGAWVAEQVDARWLIIVTAMLVLWSGSTLVRNAQQRPIPSAAPQRSPSAIPSAIASRDRGRTRPSNRPPNPSSGRFATAWRSWWRSA